MPAATHPQEAVEEEVAQVAAAAAAARLQAPGYSLYCTWLQPLLRMFTNYDAACLGAEHRRLHRSQGLALDLCRGGLFVHASAHKTSLLKTSSFSGGES